MYYAIKFYSNHYRAPRYEVKISQGGSDKFENCAISLFIFILTAPFDKGWTFY